MKVGGETSILGDQLLSVSGGHFLSVSGELALTLLASSFLQVLAVCKIHHFKMHNSSFLMQNSSLVSEISSFLLTEPSVQVVQGGALPWAMLE